MDIMVRHLCPPVTFEVVPREEASLPRVPFRTLVTFSLHVGMNIKKRTLWWTSW